MQQPGILTDLSTAIIGVPAASVTGIVSGVVEAGRNLVCGSTTIATNPAPVVVPQQQFIVTSPIVSGWPSTSVTTTTHAPIPIAPGIAVQPPPTTTIIKKILIFEDEIKLVFRGKDVAVALSDCGINCEVENAASGQEYVISLPFHRKRYGNRTVIVLDEESPETGGLNQMQSALIKANQGMDALISGEKPTIDAVAVDLGVDRSFVAKNLQLANLAPDIAKMIWEGRQPKGLTLHKLREGIPDSWAEQRRVLLG